MPIIATQIAYWHLCHRKLWLFSNGITMEHSSELVAEGRFLHESSYAQRAEKYTEISIGGSKIDFYDAKNKIVHETKKSDKVETAHEWQLRYYLYLLRQQGIEGATGILEYPRLRQTTTVTLGDEDVTYLDACVRRIQELIDRPVCPPVIDKPICKRCSYYEFCYVGE